MERHQISETVAKINPTTQEGTDALCDLIRYITRLEAAMDDQNAWRAFK